VPRVVGVIQARAGSTRLPGKVLRPLLGRPVLEWVVRAARAVESLDEVVVATTTEPGDDAVADLASSLGVRVVRGSTDDVLSRFLLAVEGGEAQAVARFTSDCPLMDPAVVSTVVAAWRDQGDCDHASTVMPRCLPRGLDAEVASVAALDRLDRELVDTALAHHRTHVTSFLYSNPHSFRVLGVAYHPDASDLRVTLDTEEDLELISALAERLGDRPPSHRDVVAHLRGDADLVAINAHVQQKALEDA
jgi:spore coat polysaccharide biosynthesis protein SpsF